MNYGFSVTKDGTKDKKIEDIDDHDYKCIWQLWEKYNIQVIYKFRHVGDNNNHVHYHGVIFSIRRITYSDLMHEGFSIKFDPVDGTKRDKKGRLLSKNEHLEQIFNYCQHEIKERDKEREIKEIEQKEAIIYKRCMEAGQPLKQQKIKISPKGNNDTLFKITLIV